MTETEQLISEIGGIDDFPKPTQLERKAAALLRQLQAENEGLTHIRNVLMRDFESLRAENEQLRISALAAAVDFVDLKAENEALRRANLDCVDHFNALKVDYDAAMVDAELYRWLRDNSRFISWMPRRFNADIVSGFAAFGTGYLGYGFEAAIKAAKENQHAD